MIPDENDNLRTIVGIISFNEFIDRSTLDDDLKEFIKKQNYIIRQINKELKKCEEFDVDGCQECGLPRTIKEIFADSINNNRQS